MKNVIHSDIFVHHKIKLAIFPIIVLYLGVFLTNNLQFNRFNKIIFLC